jgi:hypothetical protein
MSSVARQYGALEVLRASVRFALDTPTEWRKERFHGFLRGLRGVEVKVGDFEAAILYVQVGNPFGTGDNLPGAKALFDALSDFEKLQLKKDYLEKLNAVSIEFPDLKLEFPEQFS